MHRPHLNKRAFKRSMLSAISRLIGVGLAASSGDLVHRLAGNGFSGWSAALIMASISFILMAAAEYEREND